jgi:CDP-glycerol glycerophosphotransferase
VSKFTKLVKTPKRFFEDALRNLKPKVMTEQKQSVAFVTNLENASLEEHNVLYESFHGTSIACSPKAIFRELLKSEDFEYFQHFWVIDNDKLIPNEFKAMNNVHFVKKNSTDYAVLLATSKYLVSNSTFPNWYVRRNGQIYANTWHGVPIKCMFKRENGKRAGYANSQRNFLQATHILLQNNYTAKELLETSNVFPLVADRTYLIGAPRLDATIEAQHNKRSTEVPMNGPRKILFAPTWRGQIGKVSDDLSRVTNIISNIKSQFGFNFEVHLKMHNFVKLDKNNKKCNYIAVDENIDVNEILSGADILITDYSSVMVDAFAADIPVILFVDDLEDYKTKRGLNVNLEDLPCFVCKTSSELIDALRKPVRPSEFGGQFELARAKLFGLEDGQSTARAVDIIFNANTNIEPLPKSGKKLIAFFGGGWRRNGITSSALNLLSNIDYEKYDVAVLTDGTDLAADQWDQLDQVDERALQVHRCGKESFTSEEKNAKTYYYSKNKLCPDGKIKYLDRTMVREWERIFGDRIADVAIDFSGYRRLWAFLIAKSHSRLKLVYQHNDLFEECESRYPLLRGIFEIYKYFDYVVCVSDNTAEKNFNKLKVFYRDSDQSLTIRNTLNLEHISKMRGTAEHMIHIDGKSYFPLTTPQFKLGQRFALDLIDAPSKDYVNFVTMGRFSAEKNHGMLLHAFRNLKQEKENVRLYIIGEGPLWQKTSDLVVSLGLEDCVFLTGFTARALALVASCQCFVLPSKYEGQPMVLLEALALGVPAIATDIPGSRSVLSGGYGLLVEEDETVFAKAMADFADGLLEFRTFDAVSYNDLAMNDFHAALELPQL